MKGTVYLGTKPVEMLATAASPILYKKVFHGDFLEECQKEEVDTGVITQMGFIMAMNAQRTTTECTKLSEDDFIDWLSGFDPLDTIKAAGDIFGLWKAQEKPASVPKN